MGWGILIKNAKKILIVGAKKKELRQWIRSQKAEEGQEGVEIDISGLSIRRARKDTINQKLSEGEEMLRYYQEKILAAAGIQKGRGIQKAIQEGKVSKEETDISEILNQHIAIELNELMEEMTDQAAELALLRAAHQNIDEVEDW